jgi:hypothetical protein
VVFFRSLGKDGNPLLCGVLTPPAKDGHPYSQISLTQWLLNHAMVNACPDERADEQINNASPALQALAGQGVLGNRSLQLPRLGIMRE